MAVNLKGRSFLTLEDFTPGEIRYLLDLSRDLKAKGRMGIREPVLRDRHIALLFERPGLRARCAFEAAAVQEGAHVTYLDPAGSRTGREQSPEDAAGTLGRFFDGVAYRGRQSAAEDLAKWSGVPVWNARTDADHPTRILAALMTLEERRGKPLGGMKVVFPGDIGGGLCRAWMIAAAKMGMRFTALGPQELAQQLDRAFIKRIFAEARKNGALIEITDDMGSFKDADAICGGAWASAIQEDQIPKRAILLAPYRVTKETVKAAENKDVLYMHPSFHDFGTELAQEWRDKGVDIRDVDDEVFRGRHSAVLDEEENRLYAVKAVLAATIGI